MSGTLGGAGRNSRTLGGRCRDTDRLHHGIGTCCPKAVMSPHPHTRVTSLLPSWPAEGPWSTARLPGEAQRPGVESLAGAPQPDGSPWSLKCCLLVFEEAEEPGADRRRPDVGSSPPPCTRRLTLTQTHLDSHKYRCPPPSLDHSMWSSVSTSSKSSCQISCPCKPVPGPGPGSRVRETKSLGLKEAPGRRGS